MSVPALASGLRDPVVGGVREDRRRVRGAGAPVGRRARGKKEGKGQVSNTQKEKVYKIGYDKFKNCIEAYIKAKSGTEKQYLQNGSTFFNSGYIDYLDAAIVPTPQTLKPILIIQRE